MEETAQALPPYINGEESKGAKSSEKGNFNHQTSSNRLKRYKWWLQMIIYLLFVLSGTAAGTLLGKLYYDNGGKSIWMATFVQNAGFPLVLPLLFIISATKDHNEEIDRKQSSSLALAFVYIFLGLLLAADCILYSIGVMHLPVSTYSVICASQLGFNALFSFFLNAQKFTPYIINSLVLVTISATLLVFQNDSEESSETSRKKYAIGFICTVAASAGYALMMSLTQLAFQKIIKKESFREILNMSFYQCLIATLVILIGLFASGDWKSLHTEMENFKTGKVSYVMNLFWTVVSWQAFAVGSVGLIFKVSSLFSNVISMLSLPVVPVFAVIIFHDKMTSIKLIAMLLAMWGFASYIYQHYLDDLESKAEKKYSTEVSLVEQS